MSDDYERTFEEFWRDLVTLPDGSLDPDAVKRELHDYYNVMHCAEEVNAGVSGGKFSKPNTDPAYVLEAAREYFGADEQRYYDALERISDLPLDGPGGDLLPNEYGTVAVRIAREALMDTSTHE